MTHSSYPPSQNHPAGDLLALQNELRRLQLELDLREAHITRLTHELETLRVSQADSTREALDARVEQLLRAAAAPAAQLVTQAALFDAGQPLQTRDVLAVARRILRALEAHGLRFEGQVGERTAFDPNRHQPLDAADMPAPGQPVTVRVPGVRYGQQVLARAGVEIAPGQA